MFLRTGVVLRQIVSNARDDFPEPERPVILPVFHEEWKRLYFLDCERERLELNSIVFV
jgi:hypothetical protein